MIFRFFQSHKTQKYELYSPQIVQQVVLKHRNLRRIWYHRYTIGLTIATVSFTIQNLNFIQNKPLKFQKSFNKSPLKIKEQIIS